jgi:hypothetical protein
MELGVVSRGSALALLSAVIWPALRVGLGQDAMVLSEPGKS